MTKPIWIVCLLVFNTAFASVLSAEDVTATVQLVDCQRILLSSPIIFERHQILAEELDELPFDEFEYEAEFGEPRVVGIEDVLAASALPLLAELAGFLNAHPEVQLVRIDAHTDSRGSSAFNLRMTEQRASMIQLQLLELGVDAARLQSRGCGEEQPVASNRTEEGRASNRRIEFVVVQQEGCQMLQ